MKKKEVVSLIISITCYAVLAACWLTVAFGMAAVAFGAYFMEDIQIWYEQRLGNVSFTIGGTVVLVLITAAIVYVLTMQDKFARPRKRK